MKTVCICILGSMVLWCCQTTSPNDHSINSHAPYAQFRSLAEALSLHPSVQVNGGRGLEKITIRQFQGSMTEPLFVINDHPIGNDYMRANQLLNMAQVKSVRVLKGAAETIRYGSLGSYGVIAIQTL